MTTYAFNGYSLSDVSWSGGVLMPGVTGRLLPDWTAGTNALSLSFSDDDGTIGGDSTADESGNDTNQILTLRNAAGTVIASGVGYLDYGMTVTGSDGTAIQIYMVEIGGVERGLIASAPILPGVTYQITAVPDVTTGPTYGSISSAIWNSADSNVSTGWNLADDLRGGAGNDSLSGAGGNDTLSGGTGNDTLSGGMGNDTLYGGTGEDSFRVDGASGSDIVDGGSGGDEIDRLDFGALSGSGATVTFTGNGAGTFTGGSGGGSFAGIEQVSGSAQADVMNASATTGGIVLDGGAGNDTLTSGSGADDLVGGAGADRIYGGDGNDTIMFGDGSATPSTGDLIYGGAGDDVIDDVAGSRPASANTVYGDAGNDDIFTGDGNDTLYGGADNDTLHAESGDDSLFGGAGNDWMSASLGNDTLFGGDGNDTLYGGSGNDTMSGGNGDDTVYGGSDTDLISTGAGADVVVLAAGGGSDTVTDFLIGSDLVDTSGLLGVGGATVTARDVVVSDDGFGNALLTFPGGETLVLQGVAPGDVGSVPQLHAIGIPCFTAGTMILTPGGEVAVEMLRPGDLVSTRDDGPQPLLWSALRRLGARDLSARPELLPVRIAPGALGGPRGLLVSPQHGLLLRLPERGGTERLVRARHLSRLRGGAVRIAAGVRRVTYVHLFFDRHRILFGNGVPSESFYPGPWGLAALGSAAQRELAALFPGLGAAAYGPPVRPVATYRELPEALADFRPVQLA